MGNSYHVFLVHRSLNQQSLPPQGASSASWLHAKHKIMDFETGAMTEWVLGGQKEGEYILSMREMGITEPPDKLGKG